MMHSTGKREQPNCGSGLWTLNQEPGNVKMIIKTISLYLNISISKSHSQDFQKLEVENCEN